MEVGLCVNTDSYLLSNRINGQMACHQVLKFGSLILHR